MAWRMVGPVYGDQMTALLMMFLSCQSPSLYLSLLALLFLVRVSVLLSQVCLEEALIPMDLELLDSEFAVALIFQLGGIIEVLPFFKGYSQHLSRKPSQFLMESGIYQITYSFYGRRRPEQGESRFDEVLLSVGMVQSYSPRSSKVGQMLPLSCSEGQVGVLCISLGSDYLKREKSLQQGVESLMLHSFSGL
ncbi:MAG: hypothetical protein EZS28_000961 [Streblomastix strix]|uniref:Uncharacterized protein n=1 Tax=Streblomastix strix TaxID=222440 RepID=A0A5J4XAH2_9EUKA|nr:MAG: hypothetical protein EZS28_000961 [Streblomastix strix]